jgi:hypothetical protein
MNLWINKGFFEMQEFYCLGTVEEFFKNQFIFIGKICETEKIPRQPKAVKEFFVHFSRRSCITFSMLADELIARLVAPGCGKLQEK